MNKQALIFLTMLSLILMLFVYYVTLPTDSTSIMEEQASQSDKKVDKENTAAKTEDAQGKTEEAQEQRKDASGSADDSTKLQGNIDQKKEEEINRNSGVVADTKSDGSAKKEVLAAVDELKDEKSMQKSVANLLKKDSYQIATEISGDTCIISVFEQKDDKNVAETVMQKAQEATSHKYLMEVTFKQEIFLVQQAQKVVKMAQEYIALKERNNAGVIALSKSAFQTIAKIVVEEDKNIRLAGSATPFKHPISCKIVDDQLTLSIDVKVKYSVNANKESSKVQSKIFESIEHMTGYTPGIIDIHIVDFIF